MNPNRNPDQVARSSSWRAALPWIMAIAFSSHLYALETDRDQPIEISADRAELDEKNTSATYLGNVELRQGSLHISADSLYIKANAEGQVESVSARGEPAIMRQQPEQQAAPITAQAKTIDYFVVEERITMAGDARAEQQGNLFRGEVIQYDIRQKILHAFGRDEETGSGEGRVQMILQPRPRDTATPSTE